MSIATRNQHLSALRHFFDAMVTRHAIGLNLALSVRGERYSAIEGKTPEISITQARALLSSLDTARGGLRDRALLAILVYTSARAGVVAKLKCGNSYPISLSRRIIRPTVLLTYSPTQCCPNSNEAVLSTMFLVIFLPLLS